MKKIKIKNTVVAFVTADRTVIDNAAFVALSLADKTAIFSQINHPFLYVESFAQLSNLKIIKQKLLNGEDASLELAFNDLTVPADLDMIRQRYMETIAPVLAAIEKMKPSYPFSDVPANRTKVATNDHYAIRGHHKIKITLLKKIWNKMSPKWAKHWADANVDINGKRKRFTSVVQDYENGNSISEGSSSRYVKYYSSRVEIGCQTIQRYELEQFALEQGWDFPN